MKNFSRIARFMLIFGLIACSRQIRISKGHMEKHSIQANIQGLGNDQILVLYQKILNPNDAAESVQDTVIAQDGHFTYDLPLNEPVLLYLMPQKAIFTRTNGSPYWAKEKMIVVLVGPGDKIDITGELHEYYTHYEAVGSEFNEYYTQVRDSYIGATSEAVKIELELDKLMASNSDKAEIDALFQKRNEINNISRLAQLEFLKNNLEKELSAYYLTLQPWDVLEKYHQAFPPEVREGLFEQMLNHRLNTLKQYKIMQAAERAIKAGELAPDFQLNALSGDLALQSVKSKYIVLDFWASWCAPCLKGFSQMKNYYAQYQDQVEFIGINCHEPEEKWRAAVHKHELPWPQVIDHPDVDQGVALKYGIKAYPTKFILDQDKRIISKFVGEEDAFYQAIDALLTGK